MRRNGTGIVDTRVNAVKNLFRQKLNNWLQKFERVNEKTNTKKDFPTTDLNESMT